MSEKVRVTIDADERYPDFSVVATEEDEYAEVDPKTLARWQRVIKQYDAVQDEMAKARDEGYARWRAHYDAQREGGQS